VNCDQIGVVAEGAVDGYTEVRLAADPPGVIVTVVGEDDHGTAARRRRVVMIMDSGCGPVAIDAIATMRRGRLIGFEERSTPTKSHMTESTLIAMHIADHVRTSVTFHARGNRHDGPASGVVKGHRFEAIIVGMTGRAARPVEV
jgi:hypothetical protein